MTENEQIPVPAPAPQPSLEGRYSVADDGQIFWQENASNPLPGNPVGRIVKGVSMLQPAADASGHPKIQEWMDIHVRTVLEPLFILKQTEGEGALNGVARDIGERLYDHLGVMHRADLEDLIAGLDPDLRKALRSKGVRLGPVLVFLPALVKPAAIKMRAMLWALWNDKALPIAKPADGRVSETVNAEAVDRHFYRMIGYPVFGPRAIRIDMLDRVVTDIYDTAQQGVFEAKHKYAEWLGCGLDDLHAVLESMGHRKLKVDAPAEASAEAPAAEPVAIEVKPEAAEAVAETTALVEAAAAPKAAPVVTKFMLKRGKMSERPQARHHKPHHHKKPAATDAATADAKPAEKSERPDMHDKFEKFTPKKAYDPNRPSPKREKSRDEKDDRPRKPKSDRDRDNNREARVYTFEGKKSDSDDNNPFAILKNLKS